VNRAQREAYKKEYAGAKATGKPFMPYAIYKDHIVAMLAIGFVIFLAIWQRIEVGEPIDPATTDFVPRPEWYFFFLFELLKIFKNENALTPLIMATFIVPNILIVLLIITPFIDQGPERRINRRPIALATAVFVFAGIGWLTYKGATSEAAAGVAIPITGLDAKGEAGLKIFQGNGCAACHALGGSGGKIGPALDKEGTVAGHDAAWQIAHLKNPQSKTPGSAMPKFDKFTPDQYDALSTFLTGLGTKYTVK
jgi:menaquinol-cytochrome c reductase cytochrome b/c subunit